MMDHQKRPAPGRFDSGAVLLLAGSALLAVSFFLPWYRSTTRFCGHISTVTQSAFSAGGWRFDLLVLTAATAAVAVFAPTRRRLTFALALPLPFLALLWLATYDLNGPTLSCSTPPGSPAALYAQIPSVGAGPGAVLGVLAAFAVLTGAALHLTRRPRLLTGPVAGRREASGEPTGPTGPDGHRLPASRARRLILVVAVALASALGALVLSSVAEVAWINDTSPFPGCLSTLPPAESPSARAGSTTPGSTGPIHLASGSCWSDRHFFLWVPLATGVGLLAGGSATVGYFLYRRRRSSPGGGPPSWPPGPLIPGP
jgi:hypothetical protein